MVAVWNGEAEVADLDRLVAPAYVGHIGCRDRDLVRLKADIVAYRAATPNVVFRVEHQFGAGDYLATRLTAQALETSRRSGATICGMNISRWQNELLAEEWAVWEPGAVT